MASPPPHDPGHDREIDLLGVGIDSITVAELHAHIDRLIELGAHARVLNVNVHCMNLCFEQPWIRRLLNDSEVVFCDGHGVRLGAWMTGQHIVERITYADWLPRLGAHCAARGHRLYLLGGEPGVAEAAADRLRTENPALEVAGTRDGFFDKERSSPENRAAVAAVNAARPDILLVAFGMPLQERWLDENWADLDVRVGLTGGAALDYVSGRVPRGHPLLVENGMEWFARLLHEPRRLWRRYLIGNPLFLWRVLRWHWLGLR